MSSQDQEPRPPGKATQAMAAAAAAKAHAEELAAQLKAAREAQAELQRRVDEDEQDEISQVKALDVEQKKAWYTTVKDTILGIMSSPGFKYVIGGLVACFFILVLVGGVIIVGGGFSVSRDEIHFGNTVEKEKGGPKTPASPVASPPDTDAKP